MAHDETKALDKDLKCEIFQLLATNPSNTFQVK